MSLRLAGGGDYISHDPISVGQDMLLVAVLIPFLFYPSCFGIRAFSLARDRLLVLLLCSLFLFAPCVLSILCNLDGQGTLRGEGCLYHACVHECSLLDGDVVFMLHPIFCVMSVCGRSDECGAEAAIPPILRDEIRKIIR